MLEKYLSILDVLDSFVFNIYDVICFIFVISGLLMDFLFFFFYKFLMFYKGEIVVFDLFIVNSVNFIWKIGYCIGRSRIIREGIRRVCKERREDCKLVFLLIVNFF